MSEDKAREAAEKWAINEGEYVLSGNEKRLDQYAIDCFLAGYAAARESMKCDGCDYCNQHPAGYFCRKWGDFIPFAIEKYGCILHEAKV